MFRCLLLVVDWFALRVVALFVLCCVFCFIVRIGLCCLLRVVCLLFCFFVLGVWCLVLVVCGVVMFVGCSVLFRVRRVLASVFDYCYLVRVS